LKVLHITPSVRLLGARRSLLTLAGGIRDFDFEPLVLVPSEGGLTGELSKRGIPYQVLRLPPWRKLASWGSMFSRISQLREICASAKIDIIHCNEIYPNPHAICAASSGSVLSEATGRISGMSHGGATRIPIVTHMRLSASERLIRNYFLGDSTRIIAVSEGAAHDFDSYAWKAGKVRVVHNGIEFDEFVEAQNTRDTTRSELGFSPQDFVIGQVGLLMPRKRPRFVVESLPHIIRRVPGARLLLVGSASPGQEEYVNDLKNLARELKVEDRVTFLPFQPEVAKLFAACDVNLLVSNEEGFGRVIIEAAAAGVPSIGSNIGGIPELIENGSTGFIIGPPGADDAQFEACRDEFVSRIEELALDNAKRRHMGLKAQERATEQFTPHRYVEGVAAVFREAIAER
jgi:glycosyltransferase involved in cell wall biosynthesis